MYQKHGGTNVSVEDSAVSFRKPHEACMPQKVSPVCFMVFSKLLRPVSEGGRTSDMIPQSEAIECHLCLTFKRAFENLTRFESLEILTLYYCALHQHNWGRRRSHRKHAQYT
jgi:hypothetical protein